MNEDKKCWNCGGNCQGVEACMTEEEYLELMDAENEAKRDFIANGGSPELTGY